MNLEEYNVDSLREIVRELQAENEDLRRQLHQQKIPTAESHAFISKRREDLYDPDQGGRIQHPSKADRMSMQSVGEKEDIIPNARIVGTISVRFSVAKAGSA